MNLFKYVSLVVSCIASVSFVDVRVAFAQVTIQTIALTGQSAPGVPGAVFAPLGSSPQGYLPGRSIALNNLGQLSFKVELADGREALYSNARSGDLKLLALTGADSPLTPRGTEFLAFNNRSMVLNDAGITAYSGRFLIPGDDTTRSGVWTYDTNGETRLVARGGDPLPGQEGRAFSDGDVAVPLLNQHGQVVVWLRRSANVRTSILLDDGGSDLMTIAQSGTTEEFTSLGVSTFSDFGHIALSVGHYGIFSWAGDDSEPHRGIWLSHDGDLTKIARSKDAAGGYDFTVVRTPHGNSSGDVAFFGTTEHPRSTGVYEKRPGGDVQVVILEGQSAPAIDGDFLIERVYDSPIAGTDRGIYFGARLDDRRAGLWRKLPSGDYELVYLEGQPVPGRDGEVWFGTSALTFNRAGQIAVNAAIGDPDDLDSVEIGFWIRQPNGEVVRVISLGDEVVVAENDVRTVYQLGSLGSSGTNDDGRQSRFNDRGQIAFSAQFTDGTVGFFVSSPVPVPEFSSMYHCVIAFAVVMILGRCRPHPMRSDVGAVGETF